MLDDIREKQFELLVELDQICQKHKIPYSLFGFTAWQAYVKHEFVEGVHLPPTVAMLPSAIRKFLEVVESNLPSNRFLEYMGNNPQFDRLDIRYGNTNTLDFAPNNAWVYENHGLYIVVHALSYVIKDKLRDTAYRAMATDMELDTQHYPNDASHMVFHTARKAWSALSGKEREAKKRFEFLLGTDKKVDKSRVSFKPYGRHTTTYPAFWFRDTIQTDLEGHSFPVPSMYDLYFTRMYGEDWVNATPHVSDPDPELRIYDAHVPFATWLARDGMQERIAAYGAERSALTAKQSKTKVLSNRNGEWWDVVRRSGMRYKLWEEYMPQKQQILDLVNNGCYAEAEARLGNYLKQLAVFKGKGLGLCFDPDLFKAAERCLVHSGRYVYAQELRSLVPKQHWQPINLDVQEYAAMEPMVFAEATEQDLEEIKEFASRDISKGVYLYIDVHMYGLDNPNIKFWVLRSANTNCIKSVVMKFNNSMSIIADDTVTDFSYFADLVNELKPTMVSGELELTKKIIPLLEADYEVEEGWVYDITNYRYIESDVGIQPAYAEDMAEAAKLIAEEWTYYDPVSLEQQLIKALHDGMARNFIVRKDGKMIAHICTYAEGQGIGVTAALVVDEEHRDVPYGTFLESYLVDSMRKSGLQAYTFVTSKKRTKLFDAMGGEEKARYGKLTMEA